MHMILIIIIIAWKNCALHAIPAMASVFDMRGILHIDRYAGLDANQFSIKLKLIRVEPCITVNRKIRYYCTRRAVALSWWNVTTCVVFQGPGELFGVAQFTGLTTAALPLRQALRRQDRGALKGESTLLKDITLLHRAEGAYSCIINSQRWGTCI